MDIVLKQSKLVGQMTPPAFKSIAIRNIIASALCQNCTVEDIYPSKDIQAGLSFYNYVRNGEEFCAEESATVFRICFPIVAALGGGRILAKPGLLNRPHEEFKKMGIQYTIDDKGVTVEGQLVSGEFKMSGDISSQFISGLLFALPLVPGDSTIVLTTPLFSKEYVDMTIAVLNSFGIVIDKTDDGFYMKGSQKYVGVNVQNPADISLGGYFLAMGVLTGEVTANKVDIRSIQPDKAIFKMLQNMKADVKIDETFATAKQSKLYAIDADVSDCPDTAPLIAALMACAEGTSRIYGIQRLKYKESNRTQAIVDGINALGGCATLEGDHIQIVGKKLCYGEIDSKNDHRIVMMAAVMGCTCGVTIRNALAVEKSYPDFFKVFASLGGVYECV